MMRVALLIGDDLHAQHLTDQVLRQTRSANVAVSVFTVSRPRTTRPAPAIDRWHTIETRLFPALVAALDRDDDPMPHGLDRVHRHFRSLGAATATSLTDVNAPEALAQIHVERPDIVVSVRCYQKFTPDTIRAFTTPNGRPRLLNLHPGRLPAYRGVLTYLHQLANADLLGPHSLHIVAPDWADGPILGVSNGALRPLRSLAAVYFHAAAGGAAFLHDAIGDAAAMGLDAYLASATPQSDAPACYYSTSAAIEALDRGTIRTFDLDDFCIAVQHHHGTPCATALRAILSTQTDFTA